MVLDTCYAAKGGSNTAGPTKGANEVIAATNEVIQAPGVSRLSFTRVLVRVLKNFAENHRGEFAALCGLALYSYAKLLLRSRAEKTTILCQPCQLQVLKLQDCPRSRFTKSISR